MESGTKLGHYEIGTPLGKGGMGEVWRARDTKLGREVAIKTLPEEFAKDADRLVAGLRVPALWIKPYSSNEPSGDFEGDETCRRRKTVKVGIHSGNG